MAVALVSRAERLGNGRREPKGFEEYRRLVRVIGGHEPVGRMARGALGGAPRRDKLDRKARSSGGIRWTPALAGRDKLGDAHRWIPELSFLAKRFHSSALGSFL